ncbi:MAG: flagellar biosynthesis protein [Clostridiales bacterium]|nr:flagellar biosynthesis protein [Clostridiales bacterium]
MGYRIVNGKAYPVGNIGGFQNTNNITKDKNKSKTNFQDILNKKIDETKGFTVSKHASERLKNIDFSDKDMEVIEKGFKLAEGKGSKNSVMLYKDVALVTSIENKTIITAVEKDRAGENIFTNIDSVVIL